MEMHPVVYHYLKELDLNKPLLLHSLLKHEDLR